MKILRKLFALSATCVAVVATTTTGCTSDATETTELQSLSQALPIGGDPVGGGGGGGADPVPRCTPKCSAKACGASDGCGRTCTNGKCPLGTECGGAGTPNVCACRPDCTGKACGASDGCGGTCAAGACPTGASCGIGGVANQCAPIPTGQGVECFVFNDGYTNMVGPSSAIYFSPTGQACVPDNTSTGTCRKWFGRCQTSDVSHTPVTFKVANGFSRSGPSDAIFSEHTPAYWFTPETTKMCMPGSVAADCRENFGDGALADGRPVRCHLFDDGGARMTRLTSSIRDTTRAQVGGKDIGGQFSYRKWFGECEVGGCGDGVCEGSESFGTCAADCKCGNNACDNGETPSTCPGDCGTCGNGACDAGETARSCAQDCTRCGDGICSGGESCSSCAGDCGACPVPTCSGALATPTATTFFVAFEDGFSCFSSIAVFANDLSEAQTCVEKAGGTVISKGFLSSRFFHTDPRNGCASLELLSVSDDSAIRCAAAKGFTFLGNCP
jgi:hypothetical protein